MSRNPWTEHYTGLASAAAATAPGPIGTLTQYQAARHQAAAEPWTQPTISGNRTARAHTGQGAADVATLAQLVTKVTGDVNAVNTAVTGCTSIDAASLAQWQGLYASWQTLLAQASTVSTTATTTANQSFGSSFLSYLDPVNSYEAASNLDQVDPLITQLVAVDAQLPAWQQTVSTAGCNAGAVITPALYPTSSSIFSSLPSAPAPAGGDPSCTWIGNMFGSCAKPADPNCGTIGAFFGTCNPTTPTGPSTSTTIVVVALAAVAIAGFLYLGPAIRTLSSHEADREVAKH